MFENLNQLCFCILFDPFLHEICSFILLSGLDLVDDHVIEVITKDLSDFITAFRIILALVFTLIGLVIPKTVMSS